jgi:hypothetical protein
MHIQVSLKIEMAATTGLVEMEQHIQEAGHHAMREALKQAIREHEDHFCLCPTCGGEHRRLEGTAPRLIATVFGRIQVQRRRFRCQDCQRRWCPANSLFNEMHGATITPTRQEAAVLAGCSWSYRIASHLLQKLSGAQISAEEIRIVTNRQGVQQAEQQQKVAASLGPTPVPASPTTEQEKSPMLVGLDGGWVCNRDGLGGMEGKVGVICS